MRFGLVGAASPDQIADKLTELCNRGVDYVLLSGQGSRDNLRRFAREIMPAFATG